MANKKRTESRENGWTIRFTPNVHMYCHSLQVSKGEKNYPIPCEDMPVEGNFVGIWIYPVSMSDHDREELAETLLAWAKRSGMKIKLYVARDFAHTVPEE